MAKLCEANHRAFKKVWNYASVLFAFGQVHAIITTMAFRRMHF